MENKKISLTAALAALSCSAQILHLGYQSPTWGMWIDVVAVFWLVSYFLAGYRQAIITGVITSLFIIFFSPDTWLGALMKFSATVSVITVIHLFNLHFKEKQFRFKKLKSLIIPVIAAVLIRGIVVIPLNYYVAIPIWTGMTTQEAIKTIPWTVIFTFNAIQTAVDVFMAYLLVFKFNLNKYRITEEKNDST